MSKRPFQWLGLASSSQINTKPPGNQRTSNSNIAHHILEFQSISKIILLSHANNQYRQHSARSKPGACGSAATMGDRSQDTEAGLRAGKTTAGTTRSQASNTRAANIVSPPGSKTPPSMPIKRTILYPDNIGGPRAQDGSEPVDANALAKALKDFDEGGVGRERTPGASPCRKRQRVYGDR